MGKRQLLAGLVVAAQLPLAAVSGGALGARENVHASVPVLGAKTVVKGERSAVMTVDLPRPARISLFEQPQEDRPRDVLHMSGRGRFFGVMLRRDGQEPTGLVEVVAQDLCHRPGCQPVFRFPSNYYGLVYPPDRNANGSVSDISGTLPSGRYHLFLIADGAPVKVVLRFHGLTGTTVLRPTKAAGVEIVEAAVDSAIPDSAPEGVPARHLVYSGGETHRFPPLGGGFMFSMWKWQGVQREPNEIGVCDYRGRPPDTPTGHPYQERGRSECRGPFVAGNVETSRSWGPAGAIPKYISAITYYGAHPGGSRSIGGYMNTVGPVLDARAMLLWVDWQGARQPQGR